MTYFKLFMLLLLWFGSTFTAAAAARDWWRWHKRSAWLAPELNPRGNALAGPAALALAVVRGTRRLLTTIESGLRFYLLALTPASHGVNDPAGGE